MASPDPAAYAVFPTQAWQVCQPESGVQHIQPPAAQGAAPLGSYVYIYTRTSNDQMYVQRVLVQTSDDSSQPWITYLQGTPSPLADVNGGNLTSQAPPAAIASNHLIFLVYAGATGDQRLYFSRFNGTHYEPGAWTVLSPHIAEGLSPCMATVDGKVFLVWPGADYNGYFYAVGTIGGSDSFGALISWPPVGQVVPGTEEWVHAGQNGNPTVMAYKTDTASGFIFFVETFQGGDALRYFVFDNATNAFTTSAALSFPWPADNPPGYTVTGCTLPASQNFVIPVLIDMRGNITYYELDDSSPNYGSWADWLQCAIGGSGGDIGVSVAIPPSIEISGTIDTSPDPDLSGITIYPGQNGGALICGNFYDPAIGNNSLGYAGVALNVGKLTPP